MVHFFSFFTHTKSSIIVLSGEPDNFQALWPFAEGLVCFFIEKEGFLI
jgi:hypothetical protein